MGTKPQEPNTPRGDVALVVHAHFYQPPRENPWTDEISREPSAAPFHDWNERIAEECYLANGAAPVFCGPNRVARMVNNYAGVSFNVGPTLARWFARHSPDVLGHMRRGDDDQLRRFGAGGAVAQVWSHPILPLCSARDRRTQVLWGLMDFERRFGRRARGMWLPETAANAVTLDELIDAEIRFTFLAPEQIARVRPPGGSWSSVAADTLDTGMSYRYHHSDGSGRFIALGIFDGCLSRDLAFGAVTGDSASFLRAVRQAADRSSTGGQRLVIAASDGELYGHHRPFTDLMLAHALTEAAPRMGVDVMNMETFLAANPPSWEAELAEGANGEGTAWSCAHGLGRWQRHCGCAMISPSESGWSQAWRAPLRLALDHLRDQAATLFDGFGADLLSHPWAVRDAYGMVVESPLEERRRFLEHHVKAATPRGRCAAADSALLLMELARGTQLMYASCGWFFDDISGIEATLVIRQAAYVMDLWERLGQSPPRTAFLERLAEARSNITGTGADVFRRVCGDRTTAVHVAAAAAISAVASSVAISSQSRSPAGFRIARFQGTATMSGGPPAHTKARRAVLTGAATVTHIRTGECETVTYEVAGQPPLDLLVNAKALHIPLEGLPDQLRDALLPGLIADLTRASSVSAHDCQRAVRLAALVTGPRAVIEPRLSAPLAILLMRLTKESPADQASDELIATVGDLLKALAEIDRPAALRRTRAWVWDGFERGQGSSATPASRLHELASQIGLMPPAASDENGGRQDGDVQREDERSTA